MLRIHRAKKGLAGQRLALNLNVDLDRIPMQRGDWLLALRAT